MPNYDYMCAAGHDHTAYFSTFKEAERFLDAHDCPLCGNSAPRVLRVPTLHFLGSGWTNSVPSGRTQTKGADATKVVNETVSEFGAQNWVNAVKGSKPSV
jgi:predicted nucleic acid-binding Zn ribbon protein